MLGRMRRHTVQNDRKYKFRFTLYTFTDFAKMLALKDAFISGKLKSRRKNSAFEIFAKRIALYAVFPMVPTNFKSSNMNEMVNDFSKQTKKYQP